MSGGTDVSAGPGHFVKTAADAGHAARLRRQGELLAIAQVPGVVRLVTREGPPHDPVLVTARVDGPDLARGPQLVVEEVAALVIELAGTLADLHELGVVHGAVLAEHVLLSSDGRPVLCGFGYGARTGEPPVAEAPLPEPAVDPARAAGGPLSPASDVRALGALLDGLLDAAHTGPSSPAQVGALRAVAGRALVADPELRPSARAVAEAVRHALPSARLPAQPRLANAVNQSEPRTDALHALRRRGGASRLPLGHRRHRLKAVPLGLAAIALGALFFRVTADGSQRSGPEPAPSVRLPPPEPAPDSAPPPPGAPPPTGAPLPPPARALSRAGCPAVAGAGRRHRRRRLSGGAAVGSRRRAGGRPPVVRGSARRPRGHR